MQDVLDEASITMTKVAAREKVAEYLKAVRGRHTKEDEEILRGYKALAKGSVVIDLPHVIGAGGVFDNGTGNQGLPKLAVATASHEFVYVQRGEKGWVRFSLDNERDLNPRRERDVYRFSDHTLPEQALPTYNPSKWWREHPWNGWHRAMVPHVPPGLRPIHSLDGYVTLFEVDKWELDPKAPRDPALLKHIGGDLYAVLATWDLSELERSVLNGRTR
jgi:hypothetical protein